MNTVVLKPTVIARLSQLANEILGLINTGTSVRIWNGEKDIVNPTTGELTGKKRVTTNLDIVVPQSMYENVSKAIESCKNSNHYVEMQLGNTKLVAIATRHDEANNRFIVQFAKPNIGTWDESTSADFQKKLTESFGGNGKPIAATDDVPF